MGRVTESGIVSQMDKEYFGQETFFCTYNLLSQERNAYVHNPHRTHRETSRRNHILPPSLNISMASAGYK